MASAITLTNGVIVPSTPSGKQKVSTAFVSYKNVIIDHIQRPSVPQAADVTLKDENGKEIKVKRFRVAFQYNYAPLHHTPVVDQFFIQTCWITSQTGVKFESKNGRERWSIMFTISFQDPKQKKLYDVFTEIFVRSAKQLNGMKDAINMTKFKGAMDQEMAESTGYTNPIYRRKENDQYVEGLSPTFFCELSTSQRFRTMFTLPIDSPDDKPEIIEWGSLVNAKLVMKACIMFAFSQSFKSEIRDKLYLSSAVIKDAIPCGSEVRNVETAYKAGAKGGNAHVREQIQRLKELNAAISGHIAKPPAPPASAPVVPGEAPVTGEVKPSYEGLSTRQPQPAIEQPKQAPEVTPGNVSEFFAKGFNPSMTPLSDKPLYAPPITNPFQTPSTAFN